MSLGASLGTESVVVRGLMSADGKNEHVSPNVLRNFLSAVSSVRDVVLDYDLIDTSEIDAIVASRTSSNISLSSIQKIPYAGADASVSWSGNLLSVRKFLRDVSAAKSTIIVAADMYLEAAIHYPDIITLPHIGYDVSSLDVSVLQSLDRRMADTSNGSLSKHDRDNLRLIIQSGIDLKNGTMGSPM
jgi:hypothetical protein